ncbi:gluconate 2-dehydrogenase subunit 3 family protein [Phenylobacterium sp.]|uniref:gluconate 2-dehydrogenase subunit 3 family protein n=1 Tax=Phenylobacterium sp. TaxID=1871053 RepID=UPI0025D20AF8|nr:gluconate 2-dehydrogenase subunit 3 family protein [Phenylobacterium sp.]
MSDEQQPYVRKIDRRTALTWIGVVGAATAVGAGVVVYGPKIGGKTPGTKGYGTDPKLVEPAPAPWPRLLSDGELQAAAALSDFILPASATAPAATALGIPDFIDEWISAPYPDQEKDRPLIRNGLKALGPKPDAAKLSALPKASPDFFKRFRYLVVGAYYTTEAGFKDLGYIGNVSRATDPGPSAEVKAALERELAKLGL